MTNEQPPSKAWAVGLATIAGADRRILDTLYPTPALGSPGEDVLEIARHPGEGTAALSFAAATSLGGGALAASAGEDAVRAVRSVPVLTVIGDLGAPPADAHDAYLRLHLISSRLVAPHGLNLDGIFGLLTNVAWTTLGPCDPGEVSAARLRARASGGVLQVTSVDKFPRMTDYVTPSGVRIADADRVRLGAHLAQGTTVMHEGFVNFNAGTLGASMVEGRISAGVVVGNGSDIGGGASIMGTLSGGGTTVISIGERCLLGANSGLGISLGDDCIVEAGCYVTGGAQVTTPQGVVKAKELSGRDGLLFRRNSQSGALEVLARSGAWGGLNVELHAND